MSTAVCNMTPGVTIPRFAASSAQTSTTAGETAAAGVPVSGWSVDDDFDLLAAYLLDEGTGPTAAGGLTFDFNETLGTSSGVVSPEQSEDGGLPLVGESLDGKSSVAQVQSIIAAHVAAAVQNQVQSAMVPQPSAPRPMAAQPVLTPTPTPVATFPTLPVAVSTGASMGAAAPVTVVIHHQHAPPSPPAPAAAANNKRRRVDTPGTATMPLTGAPASLVLNNQQLVSATTAAAVIAGRGRKKTQAQIDRRRERNRILARRTRLRKKFFFESLQKDVMDLQRENAALKELAKLKLDPEESKKLLDECDAMQKLPSSVMEACGENVNDMDSQDFNLVKSIQRSQQCFVITDPSLQDNPIVYASDPFLSLTGYVREEVLGRNCRFLQGTETHPSKLDEVRKAIANGEDVTVTFINYTADGTPFWNKLFIAALRDAQNNIVNFIGVIVKVQGPVPGDVEYGKLLPGEDMDGDDMLDDLGDCDKDDGADVHSS